MSITLTKFIANAKKLKVISEVRKLIELHKAMIIQANKDQMSKGLMPTGEAIKNNYTGTDSYSVMWGKQRLSKGLQIAFYDLKYTGQFHANIDVLQIAKENELKAIMGVKPSQQKKHEAIFKMFGEVIGFPDTTEKELEKIIDSELTKVIEQKLFA